MRYCTKCVLPESHETIKFDPDGVCNICRQSDVKHAEIDWNKRMEMLEEIISQYRGKGEYDCIVPFSGGKDSTYQLWFIIKNLGLKPLVVRFNHWGFRPLVQENNIRTMKTLGADMLEFTANWKVVKLLMLESLRQTGDFCWHCHTGIFAHTMQIAVRYSIPLVIWGESSSEYRAYHTTEELEELDENAFNEMINLGIDANKMYELLNGKIELRDLLPFRFPPKDELDRIGTRAIYLGNYIKWDTKKQVEKIKKDLGWQGQPVEGVPPLYDYEKIECRWQGIRDYCKYIKRGHGRTNHLACIDIRNGELDRETGLLLTQKYDGKRPASLDMFLEILEITEDEFEKILKENAVTDWGVRHDKIQSGESLPDMEQWDRLL